MKRQRPGRRSWGSSEWALMKVRASWRGGRSEGLPRAPHCGPAGANAPLLLGSPCASQEPGKFNAERALEVLHQHCASGLQFAWGNATLPTDSSDSHVEVEHFLELAGEVAL